VPHYDLRSSNPERGIQHKFTAGKTLFIVLDMRSFKFYHNDTSNKYVCYTVKEILERVIWVKSSFSGYFNH
jgi:hypothetical protein